MAPYSPATLDLISMEVFQACHVHVSPQSRLQASDPILHLSPPVGTSRSAVADARLGLA